MTRRLVIVMALLVAVVSVALAIPMALLVANDQRSAFVSGLEVDTLATASKMSSEPYFDWDSFQEIVREPVRVECAGAGVSIHA